MRTGQLILVLVIQIFSHFTVKHPGPDMTSVDKNTTDQFVQSTDFTNAPPLVRYPTCDQLLPGVLSLPCSSLGCEPGFPNCKNPEGNPKPILCGDIDSEDACGDFGCDGFDGIVCTPTNRVVTCEGMTVFGCFGILPDCCVFNTGAFACESVR